jgi:hypothetical protein
VKPQVNGYLGTPAALWWLRTDAATSLFPQSVWGGFGVKSLYFEKFVWEVVRNNPPFANCLFSTTTMFVEF